MTGLLVVQGEESAGGARTLFPRTTTYDVIPNEVPINRDEMRNLPKDRKINELIFMIADTHIIL
jgi:hypothetical protein